MLALGERVEADRRDGRDRRALGIIARQAIFKGLSFTTLEDLAAFGEVRRLEPGERLLVPGEINDHLYLLLTGLLDVRIDHPDAKGGIVIQPGECAGEISIIDGKPATAYVSAAEPSTILAVPGDKFWEEFMPNTELARNFMKLFADRFRARNQLIQQAVEDRLQYEHLEKELAIAEQIQASMLPHDISLGPGVEVVAEMLPAKHVGGDFYDVFEIDDDEFCVAVGDVAGKGVPAALFMVRAMTILRAEMLKSQPIEEAVAALNYALSQDNARCMFVTLAVVVINRHSGDARYVSAGHNPPALGIGGADFTLLSRPSGILLGVDECARYQTARFTLAEDDVLVLYTDGITEAMNAEKELFAESRLLDCLNEHPVESSAKLSARLIDSVSEFSSGIPQSDDLTLVVARRRRA